MKLRRPRWRTFSAQGRAYYPGASKPSDEFGWIITSAKGVGGLMAGPYSDHTLAARLRDHYAPNAEIEKVRIG